jgi:hypothetical protein
MNKMNQTIKVEFNANSEALDNIVIEVLIKDIKNLNSWFNKAKNEREPATANMFVVDRNKLLRALSYYTTPDKYKQLLEEVGITEEDLKPKVINY